MDIKIFDDPNQQVGVTGEVFKAKPNKPNHPKRMSDYIADYSKLPDLILRRPWKVDLVVPKTLSDASTEILNEIKERYFKISCWLGYYRLAQDEIEVGLDIDFDSFEYQLFHTDLIEYKKEAEDELELLDLIKQYRPRSFLMMESRKSAESLWISIASSNCLKEIAEKNVLGNGDPISTSKRDYVRKGRKTDKLFQDNTVTRSGSISNLNIKWKENLETLFFSDAAQIAADDDNFRENYWKPYWEKRKQFWDKIEGNKNLQLEWITSGGEIFITGNGKRIPKEFADRPVGEPPSSKERRSVKKC